MSEALKALRGRKLIFVSGKGGVGKTTVCAALAKTLASEGKRVVVAELAGRKDIRTMFGISDSSPEIKIESNFDHAVISAETALKTYLRDQLPLSAGKLIGNGPLATLIGATPGMNELLSGGMIWDLVQDQRRGNEQPGYDVCIVDAPASGHLLPLLSTPSNFAKTAESGPIARQAGKISQLFNDPAVTAIALVCIPKSLSLQETVELTGDLFKSGHKPSAILVNRVSSSRLTEGDLDALISIESDLDQSQISEVNGLAIRSTINSARRFSRQQSQLAELRRNLDGSLPIVHLPEVASTIEFSDLMRKLSDNLANQGATS